jgi:hypothetical protein
MVMMRMYFELDKRESMEWEEEKPKYEHPIDQIIFWDDEEKEISFEFSPY